MPNGFSEPARSFDEPVGYLCPAINSKAREALVKCHEQRPIFTGAILSAGNPYFPLWWATVGLALATRARALGVLAFGLFATMHWLCDLAWLEALSWTSFKGSKLLGSRCQTLIMTICAMAMLAPGI